ncbi:MAG TPA: exonuclease subunit SbcD, partial [Bacillota bacterium]|nr:exonuclease subunit SbcD [Bacillota bacterium]
MRILHTSDWHLGKTLEGRTRLPEQQEFIAELSRIVEEQAIDLVVIAGDIFDTSNPPAAAEQLFYNALKGLAAGGKRGVVVLAGNHDNPDRLCAAGPLAASQGIVFLGVPADSPFTTGADPAAQVESELVSVVDGGPSWVELSVPGYSYHAVILALPYPSEARLQQLLTTSLAEEEVQKAYSDRVGEIFSQLEEHYRADTINLAFSHLFVLGGIESEGSERPISLGGACTVSPGSLPAHAQYIGLGHLHRPQKVGGAAAPSRYAGSPLAYSFSEAGQAKAVYLVDVEPGQPAAISEILLQSGKPLVKWQVDGGLEEVHRWIEEGRDTNAWIDMEIRLEQPLTNEQNHSLRELYPNIL